MDTDIFKDLLNLVMNASPEILLGGGMIFLGYALRFLPFFPDAYVPATCIFLPTFVYPFIGDWSNTGHIRFPCIKLAIQGFEIGVLAWLFHAKVLKKTLDKVLFKHTGHTEFLKQPKRKRTP